MIAHEGTLYQRNVILFDERKQSTYPSKTGLYVAEILLLHYCSLGNYPKPNNGYPGFWWFEYGIRDIGHYLKSLEARGYIRPASVEHALSKLKLAELKQIANDYNIQATGKKQDLVNAICERLTPDEIGNLIITRKYELTEKGNIELRENAYVPYMHSHRHKTIENALGGESFTVWDINRLLKQKDVPRWREIVGAIEEKRFGVNIACYEQQEKEQLSGADIQAYLRNNMDKIRVASKSPGDGYDEESIGIDLKSIGKDKEALYYFYVAMLKGFDAPALYRETLSLLKKYELNDEALSVCRAALNNLPENNQYRKEVVKRIQELNH